MVIAGCMPNAHVVASTGFEGSLLTVLKDDVSLLRRIIYEPAAVHTCMPCGAASSPPWDVLTAPWFAVQEEEEGCSTHQG